MAQEFVVKLDENTELYLKAYNVGGGEGETQWSGVEDAITWSTLAAAQSVAAHIDAGSIGLPKPS